MIKVISTYIVLTALTLTGLLGQEFNRPTPEGFPNYEFRKPGVSSSDGHYLMAPMVMAQQSSIRNLAIFDNNGYLAWKAGNGISIYTNFEYHPNHKAFTFASKTTPSSLMTFYVMDSTFSVVDSVLSANNSQTDIHEFRILDNGNYLISGNITTSEDLSSYEFSGVPGSSETVVLSFVIQEFEDGDLVFYWKSIDHIHPEEFIDDTYSYNQDYFDYVHGNAIELDSDGNFLVSMRHADAIYKIDRLTGDVIWKLGGNSSQFEFTNDDGFSGQHDVRVLPNGNLTLFDNGNSRPAPRFSRAVEYEIDLIDSTATRVWEYSNEYDSYSRAMGNVRTHENGERIIGFGACNRPESNFIHLDYQDDIISELLFQDSVVSYRALRADFTFELNRPEISCAYINNEIILGAPAGYSLYNWSTGEETQEISVSGLGTYQVWVNHGIGMIGSIPFELFDIENPCGELSSHNLEQQHNELIRPTQDNGIFDIASSGRIMVINSVGQLVLSETLGRPSKIDIAESPSGAYLIVLITEELKQICKRVMKL